MNQKKERWTDYGQEEIEVANARSLREIALETSAVSEEGQQRQHHFARGTILFSSLVGC